MSSNVERMLEEVAAAAKADIPQRVPGYRDALVKTVMALVVHTAEHDERGKNINVLFDDELKSLGALLIGTDT
jgi:hypothetical protein